MSIKQHGGVFGRNPTFNDLTIEGDLILNGEVFTGLDFQGSWNASTNSPSLASSTGTNGEFYIVSVAGTTNLNGITNWGIGDWAIFNGTVWQRVEGGADGNFDALTANSLTVNGADAVAIDDYILHNGDNNTKFGFSGNDAWKVRTGGVDAITVDGSQNVTIPNGNLTIGGVDLNITGNINHSGDGDTFFGFNANDSWRVVTGGAEGIKVDSSQNVTISNGNLNISGTSVTNGCRVQFTNAAASKVYQVGSGQLGVTNAGFAIRNVTDSTFPLVIDDNSNVSIPNGDLTVASGNGVFLGGTAAGNKLDDYEEGTWTPTFKDSSSNSASASTATGTYVKIGSVVHIQGTLIDINTSGLTGGDSALLGGFPFTINNASATRAHGLLQSNDVTFTEGTLYLQGNNGQVQAGFKFNKTGAAAQQIVVNAFTSGSADVFFSMSYQTTA